MAVDIRPYEIALCETDIAEFEEELGLPLPSPYRDFLLRTNGGEFRVPTGATSAEWSLGFEARPVTAIHDHIHKEPFFWRLSRIHGLRRPPGRYGDLREIYPAMRNWGHLAELLPIASEINNSKLLLHLKQPHLLLIASERYLIKYNDDEDVTIDDYIIVADTFEEFIQRLEWRHEPL